MEPLAPMLGEVSERIAQLARQCKGSEDASFNRWIADGVKKQLDLLTFNANLYSLLVEELKKSDDSAQINKQLVGLLRLGLSMLRNSLAELKSNYSQQLPMIVKGACEEISQLFIVVDRTYADFYRGQLQERWKQINDYTKQVSSLCDRIQSLERKTASQEEDANKNQRLFNAALDEAQATIQWHEEQRRLRTQQLASFAEKVSSMRQENRTFKLEVSTDLRKMGNNIFAPMREVIVMLQTEAKQLRSRAEQAESECYKHQATIGMLEESFKNLSREKNLQSERLSELASESERHAKELAAMELDHQKLSTRFAAMQTEFDQTHRAYETLVKEHATLQTEFDQVSSKMLDDNKTSATRIHELSARLEEAQRNVEALTKLKEKLQRENARLSIDSAVAKQDATRLKSDVTRLENEVTQGIGVREELRQVQQRERAAQAALERLTVDADQQREQQATEVAHLRRALAAAEVNGRTRSAAENEALEEELRVVRARAMAAEERIGVLGAALARESEKAAEMRTRMEEETREARKRVKAEEKAKARAMEEEEKKRSKRKEEEEEARLKARIEAEVEAKARAKIEAAEKRANEAMLKAKMEAEEKRRVEVETKAKAKEEEQRREKDEISKREEQMKEEASQRRIQRPVAVSSAHQATASEMPNYFGLRYEQLKRSLGKERTPLAKKKIMHMLHPQATEEE